MHMVPISLQDETLLKICGSISAEVLVIDQDTKVIKDACW